VVDYSFVGVYLFLEEATASVFRVKVNSIKTPNTAT
jgi:hypothetical protein